jgi:hypothetical protein
MAFHPFHFFRKRMKTFLAILTIVTMFIFILTGFSGSIVDNFGSWFGAGRKDTAEVTRLYGSKVTVSDLDQVLQDRRTANAFMAQAIGSMSSDADKKLSTLDPEASNHVATTLQQLRQFIGMGIPLQNLVRFGMFTRPIQDLRGYQQALLEKGKAEAAHLVGKIAGSYSLMEWQILNPLYFGGGTGADDLLDFLVWKKQADDLKINLTDEDLRKAINLEAGGEVLTGNPTKDSEKVGLYLQGLSRKPLTLKDVYSALREEYRVRLAKEVLLGSASGARSAMGNMVGDEVPGEGTPDEFWNYYKENQTKLQLALLKVPVQQFTDQVKQVPTQQELEDLFRRYKNDEPSPDQPTFGFRQPRKVKVEWVAADPESPHYREAAEKALPVLSASAPLALLPFPGALGGGTPGAVAAFAGHMAVGSLWNAPLQFEYESYAKGIKSWWDASNVTPEGTNPYATGFRRPDTIVSVAGQLIGSGLTGGTPWTAAGALGGSLEIRLAEQKAREVSMILAGAGPFPLSVVAQEAALAHVSVPPLAAVRSDLAASIRNRLAPEMTQAALAAFVKDLEAKRFSPKEAAEYVEKNANIEHGITGHAVMKELRDEAGIADDPALAPLRRTEEKGVPLTPSGLRDFAGRFFTARGPDGRPTLTQPYQPQPLSDFRTNATYYYWLTENEKAKPLNFTEARPKVEEAWKVIQARKEAKQAAEHIVEAMKNRGEGISAERFLKDEAERLKAAHPKAGYETSDLFRVSRLVRSDTPLAGTPTQYEPYKFPETAIAYPQPDAVDELLKKLNQPGDAVVITDRPERNFYVAVLEKRDVPDEREFFDVYQHAPRRGFIVNPLWSRFQAERDQEHRTRMVRHLREGSQAPLNKQGNYVIDPEVRRRIRGGPGEE